MQNNPGNRKKGGVRRYILLLLVIAWAGVIFSFSAQNADKSSETSGRIVTKVVRVIVPDYESLTLERQESLLQTITLVVRKGAHFSEYLVFGMLLWQLIGTYTDRRKRQAFAAWMIGTVYAGSDELHQMFSDGRAARIGDVCIDSAGVVCGIFICMAATCLLAAYRRKRGMIS